jgi:hypothetical protein
VRDLDYFELLGTDGSIDWTLLIKFGISVGKRG